jgi:hypothetical protein
VLRLAILTDLSDRETECHRLIAVRFRVVDVDEHSVRERRYLDIRGRILNNGSFEEHLPFDDAFDGRIVERVADFLRDTGAIGGLPDIIAGIGEQAAQNALLAEIYAIGSEQVTIGTDDKIRSIYMANVRNRIPLAGNPA